MIDSASSAVPIHDQWQAEAEFIYLPALEHRLTVDHFLLPNGEHRIVPTRVLAYGLFELNAQHWDVRLQMTINAFLCAAFAGVVILVSGQFLSGLALVLFAAVFGSLLASPLFYGNALWGFQSQFYFLLLLSCLHLWLVITRPSLSVGWVIGVICSALASVSMGSGFFSALVVVGLSGRTMIAPGAATSRKKAITSMLVHAVVVAVAVVTAPTLPLSQPIWGNMAHTFVQCLGWPAFFYHGWGVWVWLPFTVFLCTAAFRTSDVSRQLLLAIGGWVVLQIAAISWSRSAPAIVITPRYYEFLLLGLVANVFALAVLVRDARQSGRRHMAGTVRVLAAIWCAAVTTLACRFAESHYRQDLSTYRTYARSHVQTVRDFLATDNISALRSARYPMVPHPDPEYMASLLRNPKIRAMLPTELTDSPAPLASRMATALRSTARWWIIVGVGGLVGAGWATGRWRPKNEASTPISR